MSFRNICLWYSHSTEQLGYHLDLSVEYNWRPGSTSQASKAGSPQAAAGAKNPFFALRQRQCHRATVIVGPGECFGQHFGRVLVPFCVAVTTLAEALRGIVVVGFHSETNRVVGDSVFPYMISCGC